MTQPTVFISYSHKDEVEKDQLVTHLQVLRQSDIDLDLWVDDRIKAGADWAGDIDKAMTRAKVAVLLVTANFLTSEFIATTEVPRILERHRADGLAVFPIIGRACAWQMVEWLKALNVLPKNGTPIWGRQGVQADEHLAEIVLKIATELKDEMRKMPTSQEIKAGKRATGKLIYVDNFGQPSKDINEISDDAYHLDWTSHFDSQARPRRVPSRQIWTEELWPQLDGLKQQIAPPELIRLRGSASLPTGFALGHTFLEVSRYQLQVDQFSNGIVQPWYSNAKQADIDYNQQMIPGDPSAEDAAVIIFANPKQNVNTIVEDVSRYFSQVSQPPHPLKQTLLLEAQAASSEKRDLTNGEAATLAKNSAEQVRRFVGQVKPKMLHLFMAVPLGLAVFMGHQWNIINSEVQCYEWVGGEPIYARACQLEL